MSISDVCISCFLVLLVAVNSRCFLDLSELENINYAIDILDTPLILTEKSSSDSVVLASKYGQLYQCSYPALDNDDVTDENGNSASNSSVNQLLSAMQLAPCLFYVKGWWTYEFCYGREVKQYHQEDGKVVGSVMSLGHFESEFDWTSVTDESPRSRNVAERYHSQVYVNGSVCDLTGNLRRTEARFYCEAGHADYISGIVEAETCSYTITVMTPRICRHPLLRPAVSMRSVAITCNPLLTDAEYQQYLLVTNQQKKFDSHSAVVNDATSDEDDAYETKTLLSETDDIDMDDLSTSSESFQKIFLDSLMHGLQDVIAGQQHDQIPANDVKMDVVSDPRDLEKVLDEMLAGHRAKSPTHPPSDQQTHPPTDPQTHLSSDPQTHSTSDPQHVAGQPPNKQKSTTALSDDDDDDDDDEDDDDVTDFQSESDLFRANRDESLNDEDYQTLEDFEKGLHDIAPTDADRARLSRYKDTISSAMNAQFSNIVDEAQTDMAREGEETEETDTQEAIKILSQTLEKLLRKLEKAETDVQRAEKALSELDDIDAGMDGTTQQAEGTSPDGTRTPSMKPVSSIDDGKVRVRVSTVKESQLSTDKPQYGLDDENSEDIDSSALDLPESERQKLTTTVRDQLEKAGFQTNGRKIEVRIVTAGYYDAGDNSLHVLSDEESATFSKMVIAVLSGTNEEAKELERQQKLEDNYSFKWKADDNNDQPRVKL